MQPCKAEKKGSFVGSAVNSAMLMRIICCSNVEIKMYEKTPIQNSGLGSANLP